SFIGQLFGCSGYKVVFIDIDQTIIDGLNNHGSYRVVIKGEKEEEIIVPNVEAISALEKDKVIEAVSTTGILAVSVGKNILEKIIPVIAAGLVLRNSNNPGIPLDIILAENMRSAADFVREHLMKNLPSGFPLETMVGLVETSIGKMVPIIPQAELEKDPLVVFAEPYNTLIVDRKGFMSPIPQIRGLAPKSNIKAWVDRKAFIHNLGHATAAYYGHYLHPEAVYMYEVLGNREVLLFTRAVMLQSASILRAAYPDEFTFAELEDHIDDLISRFRNKALQDTIFRVGQDLIRKLGPDDRFMGAIHLARQYQMPYDLILEAMTYAFYLKASDENGNRYAQDIMFDNHLLVGIESVLQDVCGFDSIADKKMIEEFINQYAAHTKTESYRGNKKSIGE
ncbi:MAG: mannitol-1-phosphate 5-dehydrogenase, partial [Bacteroidota bacterium]|nr:mannitol-1-phosphate 5-dehydrogenase [Bacteroidota bacterium]